MNLLEVKNLCKSYPSFKLEDVSFSLPKGYIMGFIGKNGVIVSEFQISVHL